MSMKERPVDEEPPDCRELFNTPAPIPGTGTNVNIAQYPRRINRRDANLRAARHVRSVRPDDDRLY